MIIQHMLTIYEVYKMEYESKRDTWVFKLGAIEKKMGTTFGALDYGTVTEFKEFLLAQYDLTNETEIDLLRHLYRRFRIAITLLREIPAV